MNINATLFGQTITFILFVWFCMKFVWPPIMHALHERKTRIADGMAAAERGHHEHELAEKHAKEVLKKAKDQAAEIITHAQKRASEIVEESKTEARGEGEKLLHAAQAEIEQESNRAREDLRKAVAELAMAGASQVLMAEVDAGRHNALLDKLAAEL